MMSAEEHQRMEMLEAKQKAGTITADEQQELDMLMKKAEEMPKAKE